MSWIEDLFDDPTYDEEYADVLENDERTAAECEFIASQLGLGSAHRVLDLACGHGRHAVRLAPRVASIVGFDRTGRFLDRARASARQLAIGNLELVRGDMRDLAFRAEFDAAYNYFTAWGYYTDEEDLDVLVRVRKSLVSGGRFLLEFLNRDALMGEFQPRRWEELPSGSVVISESHFDYLEGRLHTRRIYLRDARRREVELIHWMPAPDELVRCFRRTGFSDLNIVSAPSGGPADHRSRRIAVIGTAP